MFAPRPQTHQVSRHYSLQTTSKKNQDKENSNANALPSKTPSRAGVGKMLIPNTAAASRVGLGGGGGGGKGGMVGHGQLDNGKGKGKGKEVDDIGKSNSHHFSLEALKPCRFAALWSCRCGCRCKVQARYI